MRGMRAGTLGRPWTVSLSEPSLVTAMSSAILASVWHAQAPFEFEVSAGRGGSFARLSLER